MIKLIFGWFLDGENLELFVVIVIFIENLSEYSRWGIRVVLL